MIRNNYDKIKLRDQIFIIDYIYKTKYLLYL